MVIKMNYDLREIIKRDINMYKRENRKFVQGRLYSASFVMIVNYIYWIFRR